MIIFYIIFFFPYKIQIEICQHIFQGMPLAGPRPCLQLCVLGLCVGLVTQGAGPGLMPPSAPVKAMPRTQLAIKLLDAGVPLMLVLHAKLDKTQCLSLFLCKLLSFRQNYYFARKKGFIATLLGVSLP